MHWSTVTLQVIFISKNSKPLSFTYEEASNSNIIVWESVMFRWVNTWHEHVRVGFGLVLNEWKMLGDIPQAHQGRLTVRSWWSLAFFSLTVFFKTYCSWYLKPLILPSIHRCDWSQASPNQSTVCQKWHCPQKLHKCQLLILEKQYVTVEITLTVHSGSPM